MIDRRTLITGLAAMAASSVFAQEVKEPAPVLKRLHKYGANNFYFNVAERAYEAAFKEPLKTVKSADDLKAALTGEQWGRYKQAVRDNVSALMPLVQDEAALKTLKKPGNFDNLRKADGDRYKESRIEKAMPKNTATNPLYARIRELAQDRVIEFPQAAEFIQAIDSGDFYNKELPAFVSEKAGAELVRPTGGKPASSPLKFD